MNLLVGVFGFQLAVQDPTARSRPEIFASSMGDLVIAPAADREVVFGNCRVDGDGALCPFATVAQLDAELNKTKAELGSYKQLVADLNKKVAALFSQFPPPSFSTPSGALLGTFEAGKQLSFFIHVESSSRGQLRFSEEGNVLRTVGCAIDSTTGEVRDDFRYNYP